MAIDAIAATLAGTVIGAFAGVAGSVLVAVVNKRSDEKKHLRQLAFEAGVTTWKLHCDIAEKATANGVKRGVDPLEAYILNSLVFSRIVEDGDLGKEAVLRKWKEIDDIAQAVHAEIRKTGRPAN